MRVAIMQPYFLPYIGYFQLIASADLFIVYDNIKYTKKGWINRNRMVQNGKDVLFSLPLKRDSDFLSVCDREIASDFDSKKLLRQFAGAYRDAPYIEQTLPLIEDIVKHADMNLFQFVHNSIVKICRHLEIQTVIKKSSEVPIDHELKSQEKVLALCNKVGATTYINSAGGIELYSESAFHAQNIDLRFIRSKSFQYSQFGSEFIPWLSIVDVLMFNPREHIRQAIHENYDLFLPSNGSLEFEQLIDTKLPMAEGKYEQQRN